MLEDVARVAAGGPARGNRFGLPASRYSGVAGAVRPRRKPPPAPQAAGGTGAVARVARRAYQEMRTMAAVAGIATRTPERPLLITKPATVPMKKTAGIQSRPATP